MIIPSEVRYKNVAQWKPCSAPAMLFAKLVYPVLSPVARWRQYATVLTYMPVKLRGAVRPVAEDRVLNGKSC